VTLSVETLWKTSDVELLAAYYAARRGFAEKKFARDSHRARLEWQRAKAFLAAPSRYMAERNNIVDASDELGRKGQELREMTRDLDLLKADVDLLDMIIRLRRGLAAAAGRADDLKAEENDVEAETDA
jgi:hypothetical protein